jgi:CubicO group peptidase (beta-lactamase class C family)
MGDHTGAHHRTIQQIRAYVSKAAELYDLPGLAIGIRASAYAPPQLAGLDCTETAGFADFETKSPLQPDTVFHMASLAKTFTSTCLLSLCDEGLIGLEDRLCERLPGFQMDDVRTDTITLSHVLNHTAGIPDIEDYHWQSPEIDPNALSRYAQSGEIRALKLLHDPGTRFQYSNIGYDILGAVIEAICGVPFEYAVSKRIFEPLGMADTSFLTPLRSPKGRQLLESLQNAKGAMQDFGSRSCAPKCPRLPESLANHIDHGTSTQAIMNEPRLANHTDHAAATQAIMDAPRLAMPHLKDEGNHIVKQRYYPYNRAHTPSSTLTSTLSDIAKWGECHLSGFRDAMQIQKVEDAPADGGVRLLSRAMYTAILSGNTQVPNNGEQMGLGWFKRTQQGHLLLGHEGSDDGFRSSFWICPELGIQILVCANIGRAPVKKINKELFSLLVD